MGHWTLDDINWAAFDRSKVNPEIAKVIRAAALVEFGGNSYAAYLANVFHDDAEFKAVADQWAAEEVQHGRALARWAQLEDPSYNLDDRYAAFRKGYSIDENVDTSIRGSRSGELIARCMVETGTSSYYTALAEATAEPVLKQICQKIAADELRHYKLFYDYLKRYSVTERMSLWQRLKVAVGRIAESEDDELAYAYYAANHLGEAYDRGTYSRAYMRRAYANYRPHHVSRAVSMVFKACGLSPQGIVFKGVSSLAWWAMARKNKQLEKLAA